MKSIRQTIGGLGNLMFKEAYILNDFYEGKIQDIYLQDFKIFDRHKEQIRHRFRENITDDNRIAIHIRRGDYTNNPFYIDLTQTDYYQKALDYFPDAKFLVFCRDRQNITTDLEDRKWVMEFMDSFGINWDLASYENSETDDLNQMASCQGLIGANSSFSLWAAYLGNPNKKVILPQAWFADGIERVGFTDEQLKNWIFI